MNNEKEGAGFLFMVALAICGYYFFDAFTVKDEKEFPYVFAAAFINFAVLMLCSSINRQALPTVSGFYIAIFIFWHVVKYSGGWDK